MTRVALPLLLSMLVGCKDKPAPVSAVTAEEAAAPAQPQGWTLTLPKLDGYLRYQRTILIKSGKLAPPPWDGGALKAYQEPSIEDKANADEKARREAGLSEEDIEKTEALISAVSGRRLAARLSGNDRELPLPPATEELDGGGLPIPAEYVQAITAHERARKTTGALDVERERFGSANVDVLLLREEEALKNWAALMELNDEQGGRPR